MCKELAKELRNKLKELGYNRTMVGVTSDYDSINVAVKSIDVDFKTVEELANNYEKLDRDHLTGEILLGGNTYVNVNYSDTLKDELKNKYMDKAEEVFKAIQNSNELENIFIKDGIHAFLGDFQMIWFRVPQSNGTVKRYKCYNCAEGIAEVFANIFLNDKIDIIEIKEVSIVEELKQENKNNSEVKEIKNKNIACNVGFADSESIVIDIENLFDNVTIENDKRLSEEDSEKMGVFKTILEEMREKFNLYLNFYKENPINKIDYDGTIKEINGVKSYKNLEYEFVDTIVFREVKSIIEKVYEYFRKKYDVKLETLTHDTDYYEGRPQKMKENFDWFMSVSINDLLDDIFNQLGGMTFNDKGLEEAKEKLLNDTKAWKDEEKIKVKNGKITINNFMYYDYWGKSYGEYRNSDHEKIINLFKIISYADTKELKNNYEFVTSSINSYNNKYIGLYEIDDTILKSFKTFKNGKVEIVFNSGLQALNFAIKYLGYQE
jgi:hypothetical protein